MYDSRTDVLVTCATPKVPGLYVLKVDACRVLIPSMHSEEAT